MRRAPPDLLGALSPNPARDPHPVRSPQLTRRRQKGLARATSAASGTERKTPARGAGVIHYPEAPGNCTPHPLRAPSNDVTRSSTNEDAGGAIILSCPAVAATEAKGSSRAALMCMMGRESPKSLEVARRIRAQARSAVFLPSGFPECHAPPTSPNMQRGLHAGTLGGGGGGSRRGQRTTSPVVHGYRKGWWDAACAGRTWRGRCAARLACPASSFPVAPGPRDWNSLSGRAP